MMTPAAVITRIRGKMDTLLFKDEVFQIRGAAHEVHNEMGNGFLEAVYQECLQREFEKSSIPYVASMPLNLNYKGQKLVQTYRPDFICFDQIIVELKAATTIAPEHRAQLLNYLKATGLRLGLIINFGTYPKLQLERLVK
jgi:GxxExxY protein